MFLCIINDYIIRPTHQIPMRGILTMTSMEFAKNLQSTPANSCLPESNKEFLPKISYDPTTAKYFDEFQTEPSKEAKVLSFYFF
jgi:hypothetical protein